MPPTSHPRDFTKPFFDTNILLYSAIEEDLRSLTATNLLEKGGLVSVQVLNEFASISRSKYGQSWPEIRQKLDDILIFCGEVLPLTTETHELAIRIAERYQYHIYDALILASAIEAGCDGVYSEDMQDGQIIEGVTIRNPFVAP